MERMLKPGELDKPNEAEVKEGDFTERELKALSESDRNLYESLEDMENIKDIKEKGDAEKEWKKGVAKAFNSIREDDEKEKLEFEEKYERKMKEWKRLEKGFSPGMAGRFHRETEETKEKFRVDPETLEKLESGEIRMGSKKWKKAKREFSEKWPTMKGTERFQHKWSRNWSLRNLFLGFGLRTRDKNKKLLEVSPDDPREWENLSKRPKFNPDNAEHYAVSYEPKKHKPFRKSRWVFWKKEPVLKKDEEEKKEAT